MSLWRFLVPLTLGARLVLVPCAAQTGFSTLYSFTGQNGDGGEPVGTLAIGKNGEVYGTTATGGSGVCNNGLFLLGCGTVFVLNSPATSGGAWTESVLYRFTGANGDGWSPYGSVVIDSRGRLYGTTLYGGTGCDTWGCGTVFELAPPSAPGGIWTETVVYSFTGQNGDGSGPAGTLALGKNGELYGLTTAGGSSNNGTVYRLAPPAAAGEPWTESILYSFALPNFSAPQGYPADIGLIVGDRGELYGATPLGGRLEYGVVFGLLPPKAPDDTWTKIDLFTFPANSLGGVSPSGGVVAGKTGKLYGSTVFGGRGDCPEGCGIVFELTPPAAAGESWHETVICDFGDCLSQSGNPQTNMVLGKNGVLYGTALTALFALRPPLAPGGTWQGFILQEFNGGSAVGQPSGLAISDDGVLFGTTLNGGLCNYCGTVYRWAPPEK